MTINMQLSHKIIFLTGATSGFGHAMALKFAEAGARVIATGRRTERLDELKHALKDKVHTLTLDARDNAAINAAIAALPKVFADVNVLINNAGLALGFDPVPNALLADWEQMVDTNIKGVLYATNALLPHMVEQDDGHIVNIGSIAGNYPYPGGNVYGGTKAFLKQFSLNLRADLLGKNIRVTNIEPGMAETEFSLVRFHGDQAKADSVYKGIKPLTAEDVANTVFFALTCPKHVNINRIELMPTMQAYSPFAVHRKG